MGWREAILGADGKRWEESRARKASNRELAETKLYIEEFGKPKSKREMTNRERRRYGYPAYKGPSR